MFHERKSCVRRPTQPWLHKPYTPLRHVLQQIRAATMLDKQSISTFPFKSHGLVVKCIF